MSHERNLPHPNEQDRLVALHNLQILETPIEQRFEAVTNLLKSVFSVPVSALSLIDLHRQWFKSIQGLQIEQTRRCVSFCQHTILGDDVMVVPDARFSEKFGNNPLVTGDPEIVFYAGVPIRTPEGHPVASLCIIDFEPRSLDQREINILKQFGGMVERMLLTPRTNQIEESIISQVGESWRSSMIEPLTRLWNAEGMRTLIRETVIQSKRSGDQIAIATIQLNGLGQLSRAYGAPRSEQVVHQFSRRAIETLYPFDTIGHLGNGEFAVMMTKLADASDARTRLASIRDIARSFSFSEGPDCFPIDAAIGCVIHEPGCPLKSPEILDRVEELLAQVARGDAIHPINIARATENGNFQAAA